MTVSDPYQHRLIPCRRVLHPYPRHVSEWLGVHSGHVWDHIPWLSARLSWPPRVRVRVRVRVRDSGVRPACKTAVPRLRLLLNDATRPGEAWLDLGDMGEAAQQLPPASSSHACAPTP